MSYQGGICPGATPASGLPHQVSATRKSPAKSQLLLGSRVFGLFFLEYGIPPSWPALPALRKRTPTGTWSQIWAAWALDFHTEVLGGVVKDLTPETYAASSHERLGTKTLFACVGAKCGSCRCSQREVGKRLPHAVGLHNTASWASCSVSGHCQLCEAERTPLHQGGTRLINTSPSALAACACLCRLG